MVRHVKLQFISLFSSPTSPYVLGYCKTKASGSFPIHLACSRLEERVGDSEEDDNRLECVKLLLGAGKTPISIKDGNKQTILHSAARAGHCKLLKYIMYEWILASETKGMKFKSHNNLPGRIFDWHDRWFRTVRLYSLMCVSALGYGIRPHVYILDI